MHFKMASFLEFVKKKIRGKLFPKYGNNQSFDVSIHDAP